MLENNKEDEEVTIRIIQPVIDREMWYGGPITLMPGHLEEGVYIDKDGCVEINYG